MQMKGSLERFDIGSRRVQVSKTGVYMWFSRKSHPYEQIRYKITVLQVGPAVSDLVNLPSLGGEPLQFGFEVLPLEDGINVVEVNPKKTNPLLPTAPTNIPILPQIPGLISTFGPVNPDSKQSQATVFTGPPVLPPPPPIIVIEEEPEPVNISYFSKGGIFVL